MSLVQRLPPSSYFGVLSLSFLMACDQVAGYSRYVTLEIAACSGARAQEAVDSQVFGGRGDPLHCSIPPRRVLKPHVGWQRGAQLWVGTCLTGLSRLDVTRAVPTLYQAVGCLGQVPKRLMFWWLCSREPLWESPMRAEE